MGCSSSKPETVQTQPSAAVRISFNAAREAPLGGDDGDIKIEVSPTKDAQPPAPPAPPGPPPPATAARSQPLTGATAAESANGSRQGPAAARVPSGLGAAESPRRDESQRKDRMQSSGGLRPSSGLERARSQSLPARAGPAVPTAPAGTAASLVQNTAPQVYAALNELVDTERVYVNVLHLLVDRYMATLKPLLEPEDISAIFGNSTMIKGVNEALLTQLERSLEAPPEGEAPPSPSAFAATFASIFIRMLPFLKSYATYCSGYFTALERLTHVRSEKTAVQHALTALELELAKKAESDVRLTSCLIRPVKRLTLYPLLLEALQKRVVQADPPNESNEHHHEQLRQANQSVRGMAESVNSMVRDAESRVKMLEVHERLHGSYAGLIEPSRRFVLEATLMLRKRGQLLSGGAAPVKEYKLWLLSDKLLLARPDRFSDQYFHLKEDFPLENVSVSWQTARAPGTSTPTPAPAEMAESFDLQRGKTMTLTTSARADLTKTNSSLSMASHHSSFGRTRNTVGGAGALAESADEPSAPSEDLAPMEPSVSAASDDINSSGRFAFWIHCEPTSYLAMCPSPEAARRLYAAIVDARQDHERTTVSMAALRANVLDSSDGHTAEISRSHTVNVGASKKLAKQPPPKQATLSWPSSTTGQKINLGGLGSTPVASTISSKGTSAASSPRKVETASEQPTSIDEPPAPPPVDAPPPPPEAQAEAPTESPSPGGKSPLHAVGEHKEETRGDASTKLVDSQEEALKQLMLLRKAQSPQSRPEADSEHDDQASSLQSPSSAHRSSAQHSSALMFERSSTLASSQGAAIDPLVSGAVMIEELSQQILDRSANSSSPNLGQS